MLRKFRISAPGKIILSGEHSVVYNQPAIAGPVNLRTYFTYNETKQSDHIVLNFKRLDLVVKVSLKNANQFLNDFDCLVQLQPMDFLLKLRTSKDFILNYVDIARELVDKEFMAIASTLYIFNRVFRSEKISSFNASFAVEIDSDISIGAGCGSSASYGVCLSAGFYTIATNLNSQTINSFSDEMLSKISQWAFDSEVLMHERPSGIDNTICTYGKLVKFLRGQQPEAIKTCTKIDILIVDTKVTRSTSQLVAKVAKFKERFPDLASSIFTAMGHLVNDFIGILENSNEKSFDELNSLVEVNNNLLRSIGVSHESLERIFAISDKHGFNSKLTGAGGGGCAFVLLPEKYSQLPGYHAMMNELKSSGFDVTATSIVSGTGVDLVFDF